MALNFLQFAYDAASDVWDLPDINYLKSLDGSESSRQVLEDVAKEAAKKLLAHFATLASQRLLDVFLEKLEKLSLPDTNGKTQVFVTEVEYDATNSRIEKASRPLSLVSVDGGHIRWTVQDIGLLSVGDWKYGLAGGLYSDRGTYEFSLLGAGFEFSIDIINGGQLNDYSSSDKYYQGYQNEQKMSDKNNFSIRLGECNFSAGQADLQFGGSPSCMLFQCFFDQSIKPGLASAIPDSVTKALKETATQSAPFLQEYSAYWPLACGVLQVTSDLVKTFIK